MGIFTDGHVTEWQHTDRWPRGPAAQPAPFAPSSGS